MNTTELGVYILGATALALLAGGGVAYGSPLAVLAAILAAGLSYLSQVLSATREVYRAAGVEEPILTGYASPIACLSIASWAVGFFILAWGIV